MRLLSFVSLSVFAMCVVAAPPDFELHSPLAIPIPGSSTYDADVAAAVAYARSHSSPNDVKRSPEGPRRRICGDYTPGHKIVWSTGTTVCGDTDPGEKMVQFTNRHCGICFVFSEHGCLGEIIGIWGKATPPQELPTDKFHWARGGQSYFCY